MIKGIYDCEKCGLCNNQKPLLEGYIRDCQIFWVGLSAKKITDEDDIPLSPNTKSGLLIKSIEDRCDNVITYKTNLVKCLPLNDDEKLRYPNRKEVDACFENLTPSLEFSIWLRILPKSAFCTPTVPLPFSALFMGY